MSRNIKIKEGPIDGKEIGQREIPRITLNAERKSVDDLLEDLLSDSDLSNAKEESVLMGNHCGLTEEWWLSI